MKSVDK